MCVFFYVQKCPRTASCTPQVANAVAALTDKAQLLVQKLCEKNDELDEERAVAEQALADQVATLTASSFFVRRSYSLLVCIPHLAPSLLRRLLARRATR
jgi:hypothetical protein